ncbi:4-hydroxythreonine-4-phosphate dehydrogenase [Bacteroidia bacterium]|nr:4-hydroxythreonine-4-phosphate dehydrogenase [Bacteroidia bacterium]GHT04145.1 4-hydroxythreonine-4-phosphate dehydrogenase [Bacteroidia bacterium]GHT50421.1 4-hydroxythreonine-4-phosphate dehydrogenase [Bacteroidia bacterium]
MSEKIIKVGISHGDINGIAYELILKTFDDARIFESCIPVLYGSSKILAYHRKALELPSLNVSNINRAEDAGGNRLNIINVTGEETVVELGKPTVESAKSADQALAKALEDLKSGVIDALITAPAATGSTHSIETKTDGAENGLRILVNNSFRIALATDKVTLAEVPSLLTREMLTEKIKVLQSALIRDFMITFPRIAVLSLNPQVDMEETTTLAIKAASDAGVHCFGPYTADDFFASDRHKQFDAVLAMYYDQGIVAFQMISNEENALFIGNLPYIITAPNQNTSFEKAGKNESSPDSLRNALYLAIDIYHNRETDKEIHSNPLKKQYFERGSDNEKLDLTKEDI